MEAEGVVIEPDEGCPLFCMCRFAIYDKGASNRCPATFDDETGAGYCCLPKTHHGTTHSWMLTRMRFVRVTERL